MSLSIKSPVGMSANGVLPPAPLESHSGETPNAAAISGKDEVAIFGKDDPSCSEKSKGKNQKDTPFVLGSNDLAL